VTTMPKKTKRYKLKIKELNPEDIERKLADFESRYGMTSREFYKKYNRCEFEEENLEFLDWAGYYDMAAEVGLVSLELEA
jgi:hypothetical protein